MVIKREISDESRIVFGQKMTFCTAKRSYVLTLARPFIVEIICQRNS